MLVPMATALKDHKALLAWEIINEAEVKGSPDEPIAKLENVEEFCRISAGPENPDLGLVYNNKSDDEPCFDTTALQGFQGTM